jgi:hypothetical protein
MYCSKGPFHQNPDVLGKFQVQSCTQQLKIYQKKFSRGKKTCPFLSGCVIGKNKKKESAVKKIVRTVKNKINFKIEFELFRFVTHVSFRELFCFENLHKLTVCKKLPYRCKMCFFFLMMQQSFNGPCGKMCL